MLYINRVHTHNHDSECNFRFFLAGLVTVHLIEIPCFNMIMLTGLVEIN